MKNKTIHQLIIIGAGPAGYTAAIYAARAQLHPLLIEGSNPGGQLMGTTFVENWPGQVSIAGHQLMRDMRTHAQHYGTSFLAQEVVKVDVTQRPFTLWTNKNEELKANALIIATGAQPRRLNCPGEDTYWGKGVTSCAVCDGAFYQGKKVVILGGGDTAMEDASFMTKFTNDITVIHVLDKLTASVAMQQRVLNNPAIKVMYNSTITEFHGNQEVLTSITVLNKKTNQTRTLDVDAVFLAIGLLPQTTIFKEQLALTTSGHLAVHDNVKTSVEGVFAAGDVADARYRQAVTSAGSGCMAALEAEHFLTTLAS